MDFTKRLRPGVQRGDITCSIRIWHRPRVKVGNRYDSTGVGQIEIDSDPADRWSDITPELARESGFNGVVDLLKIAKHGSGTNVYLVRFHRVQAPAAKRKPPGAQGAERRQAAQADREDGQALPEGEAKRVGRHMSLEVRRKRFGWFMVDHHGDGRVASTARRPRRCTTSCSA